MKRSRSNCEEECCVPLSKRINNLHINNGACCNGLPSRAIQPWHSEQPAPHAHENGYGDNREHWAASTSAIAPNQHPVMRSNGQANFTPMYAQDEPCQQQRYLTQEPGSAAIPHSWPANHGGPPYNPDLDATDNPFYYNNNKLLYELYIERLQRLGLL